MPERLLQLGTKSIDCPWDKSDFTGGPTGGCYGFGVLLPSDFTASDQASPAGECLPTILRGMSALGCVAVYGSEGLHLHQGEVTHGLILLRREKEQSDELTPEPAGQHIRCSQIAPPAARPAQSNATSARVVVAGCVLLQERQLTTKGRRARITHRV